MNKIYRHIDVCLNRISEGLRVVDEIVRFHLEDEDVLKELKEIRHSVRSFFSIPENLLLNARDSVNDPGFNFTTKTEESRSNITSIARASFKRIIESLRILEEYSKLDEIKKMTITNFEKLRQIMYTKEKNILLSLEKKKNLAILKQKIYPITPDYGDTVEGNEKLFHYCKEISKVSKYIQLRLKNRSKRKMIKIIQTIKSITDNKLNIIINDDISLCISEDLFGVHLGQDDLPLELARRTLGYEKIIGISTHNIEQAEDAVNEGADYIGIGPIYETLTKNTGYKPLGTDLLTSINNIAKEKNVFTFAIGGIKKENIKKTLNTGVDGVAIISELKENTVDNFGVLL